MMDKVYVMDNRGREKEATKVRYFKYNDTCYFVYTFDELDNEDYTKLYIKRMINGEDVGIDDDDWSKVKKIVQEVFREIKAGTMYSYEDLDYSSINEIMETDSKIFKLRKNVVDEIINKKIEVKEEAKEEKNINDELIETFKKAMLNSKNNQPIEEPTDRIEKIGPIIENVVDNVIMEEPTIKEELVEKLKPQESISETKSKLKPVVVGSIPVNEYKEKITNLEETSKKHQEMCNDLKEEMEALKEDNYRLQKNIEEKNKEIAIFKEKIDYLKQIFQDL